MSSSRKLPSDGPIRNPSDIHEDATVPPPPAGADTAAYTPPGVAKGQLPTQLPAPFGRYRLLKLLGQGGMGAVYLAHDSQLDLPVALKIPLFGADEGSQVLTRFYREARAAATILHPNVCPVYDVGESEGVPYLTMGFIEGRSLAEFVSVKTLTQGQSASLVRKLALALKEAHKKGVIHRDLKPANIMIDKRGEPVIMDFGLARRNRRGDARLTQRGEVMGTPAYMAPEQVSGDTDAMGPACDIYSLGVILYELICGRLPFRGDPMAMIAQVVADEPPPPSKFRPGLDSELEDICKEAMAKKAPNRYGSMDELAKALSDYLRGKTMTQERPVTMAPAPAPSREIRAATQAPNIPATRSPRRGRRRKGAGRRGMPWWLWLAGAAGVGFVLLLGWAIYRIADRAKPPPVKVGYLQASKVDNPPPPSVKELPEQTSVATTLVDALARGDYAAAGKDFDPVMQLALPSDKMKELWETLLKQVGKFQKRTATRVEKLDEYDVVVVTCQCERSALDARVVFNADKQVAGLNFRPAKAYDFQPPPRK